MLRHYTLMSASLLLLQHIIPVLSSSPGTDVSQMPPLSGMITGKEYVTVPFEKALNETGQTQVFHFPKGVLSVFCHFCKSEK